MIMNTAVIFAAGCIAALVVTTQHCTIAKLDAELETTRAALKGSVETSLELQRQIDTCNAALAERDAKLAEREKEMEALNEKLQTVLATDADSRDWWNVVLPDAMRRMRDAGTDGGNKGGQTDPAGASAAAGRDTSVPMPDKR